MYSLEQEDQVRGELSYISCLDMINGCLPSSSQSFPWPSWWIPKLCSDTSRINIHDNVITQKYFTRIVVCMAHTAIMEQSQWVNVLSPVTHLFLHLNRSTDIWLTFVCVHITLTLEFHDSTKWKSTLNYCTKQIMRRQIHITSTLYGVVWHQSSCWH